MKRMHLFWILLPLFNTLYQFSLKIMAGHITASFGTPWFSEAISSPWLWVALCSELCAFALWVQILSHCNLSKAFPLTAMSYLLVLGVGWWGFGEQMQAMQWLGSALILAGIAFIATADTLKKEPL